MKKFSRYAKKRFKSIADQLAYFGTNAEPELLHKIRLEVKKIKTILNVTEFCVMGFDGHKNYLPFRSIFRKAGEIRQSDVFHPLLIAHKINLAHGIQEKIHPGHDTLVPAFQNDLPEFLLDVKRGRRKLMEHFKKVKRSCLKKYLNLKKEELKIELYPKPNQRTLHKTRKALKEVLYLSTISKNPKKKLNPFYETLQVLIGQWHDKQMLMVLLKADKNSEEIKRLRTECRNDIKNVTERVQEFYGSK